MKNCTYKDCNNQIDDKYMFCFAHYKTGQYKTDASLATITPKGTQWHDDPVVDVLLKMNANLKRIGDLLDKEKGKGNVEEY